jgi:hypothetical protein
MKRRIETKVGLFLLIGFIFSHVVTNNAASAGKPNINTRITTECLSHQKLILLDNVEKYYKCDVVKYGSTEYAMNCIAGDTGRRLDFELCDHFFIRAKQDCKEVFENKYGYKNVKISRITIEAKFIGVHEHLKPYDRNGRCFWEAN